MGGVWRAYDTGTDRTVALKVLPAQFAKDPTYEERFRREAQAAARLHNPHIVPRQQACAIGAEPKCCRIPPTATAAAWAKPPRKSRRHRHSPKVRPGRDQHHPARRRHHRHHRDHCGLTLPGG
jgi:hypothetical protein